MRILFAGGSFHSAEVLRFLLSHEQVVAVLTQPSESRVRGKKKESPLHAVCRERHLPLFEPMTLKAEARDAVLAYHPDILVCAAYGKIFGPKFLSLFPQGGINLHPSLLPHYRGPSPIHAAILAGDKVTGVTIQQLSQKMDEGDILLQEELGIEEEEGRLALESRCFHVGKRLLVESLQQIRRKSSHPHTQSSGEASYCSLISREDGRIHWEDSALDITRKHRAYEGWPGIYSTLEGKRLKLLRIRRNDNPGGVSPGTIIHIEEGIHVQTGSGHIIIDELQREGKKPLSWNLFLRGQRNLLGRKLGT